MASEDTQKILETIQQLEQRMDSRFQQLEQRMDKRFTEAQEEMQGGFAVTHERIAQAEQDIQHTLEAVIDINESLEKRVEKLESEAHSPHTH